MICQRATELLPEYLYGFLKGRQRQEIDRHLRECRHCQVELEIQRRALLLVEAVQPVEPPVGLWNGVRERISQPEPPLSAWRRWFVATFRKPINAAGGLAVAATLVAAVLSDPRPPATPPRPLPFPENRSAAGYLHQHALIEARLPLADRVALGPVVTLAVRQNLAHDRSVENGE